MLSVLHLSYCCGCTIRACSCSFLHELEHFLGDASSSSVALLAAGRTRGLIARGRSSSAPLSSAGTIAASLCPRMVRNDESVPVQCGSGTRPLTCFLWPLLHATLPCPLLQRVILPVSQAALISSQSSGSATPAEGTSWIAASCAKGRSCSPGGRKWPGFASDGDTGAAGAGAASILRPAMQSRDLCSHRRSLRQSWRHEARDDAMISAQPVRLEQYVGGVTAAGGADARDSSSAGGEIALMDRRGCWRELGRGVS